MLEKTLYIQDDYKVGSITGEVRSIYPTTSSDVLTITNILTVIHIAIRVFDDGHVRKNT